MNGVSKFLGVCTCFHSTTANRYIALFVFYLLLPLDLFKVRIFLVLVVFTSLCHSLDTFLWLFTKGRHELISFLLL